MIRLYDLAGHEDARRFSPFCWRVRLALASKGLAVETVPWRFTESEMIAHSGGARVPVIEDHNRIVADSWAIFDYLDQTYPQAPLFRSERERAQALFFKYWVENEIHPQIAPVIMTDLFARIHPKDREYFRSSREARFGMTLEAFAENAEGALARLQKALEPVRLALGEHFFLTGSQPGVPDYLLFGAFQWARCVSPRPLLGSGDPIVAWRERMLDAHGGVGREGLSEDLAPLPN